jgi:hypothetical protein
MRAKARSVRAFVSKRAGLAVTAAIVISSGAASCALAAPRVTLRAALAPDQLGLGTTVHFDLRIHPDRGQPLLPATTKLSLSYPAGLGFATSGLGIETCSRRVLETRGALACPKNSRVGSGVARVEVPIGNDHFFETAYITIVSAPVQNERLHLLFYVQAWSPVGATFVFDSSLTPAPSPYGGRLEVEIPLIPAFPQTEYVALVHLRGTIGPEGITYYRRGRHRMIGYRPAGLLLPNTCPHGGFRFAATLQLQSSRRTARTSVHCPH